MNTLSTLGRRIYALGIIALGGLCILFRDFIIGRPPAWPDSIPLNPGLGYVTALVIIASGVAIFSDRKAALAASITGIMILFFSLFRHLPYFMNDWLNALKTMALLGGTGILLLSLLPESGEHQISLFSRKGFRQGIEFISCLLLALFFIASGYAHFKFAAFVIAFIPEYIPFHGFFTYFTAVCLLGGGAGLLLPVTRRWAALLSGFMISGWFLLLHIPRFIQNTNDASDNMGLCESFTLAGIFFVLAGMTEKRNQIH